MIKEQENKYIISDSSENQIINSIKNKVLFFKENIYRKNHGLSMNWFNKNLTEKELDYVFYRTKELTEKVNIKTRIAWIYNDITSLPKCKHCGNNIDYTKQILVPFKSFPLYCSQSCIQKSKDTKQKIIDTVCSMNNESSKDICNIFQLDSIKQKTISTLRKKYNDERIVNASQIISRKEGYDSYINNFYVIPLFSWEEYNNMCFKIDRYHNYDLKWKCKQCGREFTSNIKTKKIKPDGIHSTNISCPFCVHAKGSSTKEKELLTFIKTIYHGIIKENDRTVLKTELEESWTKPHEIDLWLPEINYAIEFNGTYHHGDPRFYKPTDIIKKNFLAKDIWKYDAVKIEVFKKLNLNYSIIWQYDWDTNQDSIKKEIENKINSLLN